jgi:riboflavin kinase/FMN adenylyltransferase
VEGRKWRAVVNIGTRPTFLKDGVETIEVHLLDYSDGDLYDREVEVRFLARIRDERKFENVEALKMQIRDDIHFVRSR